MLELGTQQKQLDSIEKIQNDSLIDISNDNKIIKRQDVEIQDLIERTKNIALKVDAIDKDVSHFEQVTYDKLIKDTYDRIEEVRNLATKINLSQDDISRLERMLSDKSDEYHILEVVNRQIENKQNYLKNEFDAMTREFWLRDNDI